MLIDIVDTEISVCSKELLKHLSDDIEIKQLKEEFIINLNTSELTDDKVQAFILPEQTYYGQVVDPRTYQVISRDVISRRCMPFVVDLPVFGVGVKQVQPFNRYYGQSVKRHLKSAIGDNCVIGSNTQIGENTQIINSVIGQGCTIGKNVVIKDCILWDNVVIKD